jgi:hypothetical protein
MRMVLHILTQANDALAADIIQRQRSVPGPQIEIEDLTRSEPDYKAVLEKIFEAESVHVW